MELLRSTILAACVMASFSSFAAVNVDFDVAIEPMLINGEDVGAFVTQMTKAELSDGANQLVLRVSKLVRKSAVYSKFSSDPMVITFNAAQTNLTIVPGKQFDSEEQVGDFKSNPTVKVLNEKGEEIDIHLGLLKRGKGLIRDYGDELAAYNMANDYTFSFTSTATTPDMTTSVASESKSLAQPVNLETKKVAAIANTSNEVKIDLRETVKLETLKGQFGSLTPTEKKEFLAWAIMHN